MASGIARTKGDAMKAKLLPTFVRRRGLKWTNGRVSSISMKAKLLPTFVVFWRKVRVWTVRAPSIDEAKRIALRVTGRLATEITITTEENIT